MTAIEIFSRTGTLYPTECGRLVVYWIRRRTEPQDSLDPRNRAGNQNRPEFMRLNETRAVV